VIGPTHRVIVNGRHAGLDGLTGALRRDRGVVDLQLEIDRVLRSDGRLVLAFVDVDGLKATNDAEGHAAGDQLLHDVGVALRTGLRSYDLVVRYGGDEFLCALPGTDVEGARRRFDEVARNLTEKNPRASVSMGLAPLEDGDTLDELTARADRALYAARGAQEASRSSARPHVEAVEPQVTSRRPMRWRPKPRLPWIVLRPLRLWPNPSPPLGISGDTIIVWR
jgi:diguanylate cyclase (GGDEF)-like protein